MKISVVTPNYNYGRFLRKALESVLTQLEAKESTPTDLSVEHIVMDGGSTDDSTDILKNWTHAIRGNPFVKAGRYSFRYISEPDKGQTDAINKGLRKATGDVVCWLNSDEWYLPGSLAKVVGIFLKHPKTDIVHGEVQFVNSSFHKIRVKRDHPLSRFVLQWYGCFIPSCCTFWRHRILDDSVWLDPFYEVVMDYEYWVRLMKLGYRFEFLPTNIACFVFHGSNISSTMMQRRRKERIRLQMLYGTRVFANNRLQIWFIDCMAAIAHQWRRVLVLKRLCFTWSR